MLSVLLVTFVPCVGLEERITENIHIVVIPQVTSGLVSGALEVTPEKIRAEDQDTLRTEVRYSFVDGMPNYFRDHFTIDPKTGIVEQIRAIEKGSSTSAFEIKVKVGDSLDQNGSSCVMSEIKHLDFYHTQVWQYLLSKL